MDITVIKDAILQLPQRADKNDDNKLVSTFVQVGPLMQSLISQNNQVLFGRRGTGKTHVLKYLKQKIEESHNIGIYIDMRLIGSSGSIYSSEDVPLHQRTLRLLSDVIKEIHDEILKYAISHEDCSAVIAEIGTRLDDLVTFSSEDRIEGERSLKNGLTLSQAKSRRLGVSIASDPSLSFDQGTSESQDVFVETTVKGESEPYIDYQYLYKCLRDITEELSPKKIWVLVDEFSEVDSAIQVYLADMFKRVFSPNNNVVFKIAAIEHRSHFISHLDKGSYLGLELGADVSTCNLDNFLVFGNNESLACRFYRELLLGHINSLLPQEKRIKNSDELIGQLFTQENAFIELVDAAEGVPRDAFNILSKAIMIDYYNKISIPTLRTAARQWYVQDKQKSVEEYKGANDLLYWIIEVVINKRHAKAFLLKSGTTQHPLINYLYDARILHIIKQSISGRDTPGERYDVYSIDYGCYCDLINTAKQPKGLFSVIDEEDQEIYIDVPKDDYRSIRRAILDIADCPVFQEQE